MNLFLVGGDAGRAAEVLESLRAPFFADGVLTRLPGGACLSHPPERVGGVSYVDPDGAFFAGRPIRWEGDEADGRGVLDPSSYLGGVPAGMDGRFAVGRFVRSSWQVVTDELGAYPVFTCGEWTSNSPEALRRVCGVDRTFSLDALSGLIGGGWSLSGDPVVGGVRRLPWGGAGTSSSREGAFSPRRVSELVVSGLRALADWPGRPSVVLVTGGRDSRLIFAAALRAGIECSFETGGTDDMPDVVIGRALCAAAGVPHEMLPPHPFGDFLPHWREMAGVLASTTGGTATLADAAGFPLVPNPPAPEPLPLWHTGQGGEIARGYYGAPDLDGLVTRFLARRPGRPGLLSVEGDRRVRDRIGEWADSVGGPSENLGDLFYLQRRMATWAAPTHAAVEYVRDSTSALWSWKLLPEMLGLPAAARAREEFHLRVLEELAPELVDLPFEGGRPWPAKQSPLARRVRRGRVLAGKVAAEGRRRLAARRAPSPPVVGGLSSLTGMEDGPPPSVGGGPWDEIRACVLGQPEHPAWAVLDRARVEALLAAPPERWDAMSRSYVLRLATVFGGFPAGPAAQ